MPIIAQVLELLVSLGILHMYTALIRKATTIVCVAALRCIKPGKDSGLIYHIIISLTHANVWESMESLAAARSL